MSRSKEPPTIQIGDWLQTFGHHTSVRLKFYNAEPPYGQEVPWRRFHDRRNYYIGPVHSVKRCFPFQTVTVPHPISGELVHCNTWTEAHTWGRSNHPMRFCEIRKSQSWVGWENVFIDRREKTGCQASAVKQAKIEMKEEDEAPAAKKAKYASMIK